MDEILDDGFVTIDLGDDLEECDICHQATEEAIVYVRLDKLFTIFEGSYEKHSERLTKTHQICLDRWSDIIKRNLMLTNSNKNQTSSVDTYKNIKPSDTTCDQENLYIEGSYDELISENNESQEAEECKFDERCLIHSGCCCFNVVGRRNSQECMSFN